MKKLMLAAAVAAISAGAFAQNGCGEDPVPKKADQVYTVKFTGKTTKGVKADTLGAAGTCGEGGDNVACVKRVPTKLKIKGWIAYCFPTSCLSLPGGTDGATYFSFWETKPYKADIQEATLAFDPINVIGKTPTKAEAAGTFGGTVVYGGDATWVLDGISFAGLGKFNKKNGTYSKIAGNFAGAPAASWYVKGEDCRQSSVWDCETLTMKCEETPNTVAFGKVTIKYSASASKKIGKGKFPKTPKYASIAGLEVAP